MQQVSLTAIIVGIIVGLLGVYFKEMLREAYARRRIAVRLHAYIMNWYDFLSHNKEYQGIGVIGENWYEDEKKAIKSGKEGAFKEVEKDYQNTLKKVEKNLSRKNSKYYKKMMREFLKYTSIELTIQIEIIDEITKAWIDNKFFISDEDAAILRWTIVSRVVEIRSKMLVFTSNIKYLLTILSQRGTPDQQKVVQYFMPIFRALIDIAKNMKPLLEYTGRIKDKNIFYFLRP